MELKLGATVNYFLWSLLAGFILAFIYDFLRSSRKIFRTSVFGINLEDVLFFLFSGVLMFWVAYDKNNGALRFQGFLGIFLGFWGYRFIFRDHLVRFMVWLAGVVMTILIFLFKAITFPVKIVYRVLARPFLVIGWYSSHGLSKAEGIRRTIERRRRILKRADERRKKRGNKQEKNKEFY